MGKLIKVFSSFFRKTGEFCIFSKNRQNHEIVLKIIENENNFMKNDLKTRFLTL